MSVLKYYVGNIWTVYPIVQGKLNKPFSGKNCFCSDSHYHISFLTLSFSPISCHGTSSMSGQTDKWLSSTPLHELLIISLSEYFRCSEQHISLPLAWAVCNTPAVCMLTKGNMSSRIPSGPDHRYSLVSGLLVQLTYGPFWAHNPLVENPHFTPPNNSRLDVT